MLIGIPMSIGKTNYYVNHAYVDYVREAGYEPLTINPKNDPIMMAVMCDGLILPGGVDIDPTFYGWDNFSSFSVEPEKDMFERRLLQEFVAEGKPIFGICRGLQLIARELMSAFDIKKGLRFHQHVDNHAINSELSLSRKIPSHSVAAKTGVLYGQGNVERSMRIFVNSMHHQCLSFRKVKYTADEENPLRNIAFEVLAQTKYGLEKGDNYVIIEAFSMMWGESRILAVQWHPEELKDTLLLQTFFNHENAEEQAEEQMEA